MNLVNFSSNFFLNCSGVVGILTIFSSSIAVLPASAAIMIKDDVSSSDRAIVFPLNVVGNQEIKGNLKIGINQSGTARIDQGVTLTVNDIVQLGEMAKGNGLVTVTGANSRLEIKNDLEVGTRGNGTLNIQVGGKVISTDRVFVAVDKNSIGTVTVTGFNSLLESNHFLRVGGQGKGTLNIQNKGKVSSTSNGISIAHDKNSTGTVTVTGVDSLLENLSNLSSLKVGNQGNGTLNIQDGGKVSSTSSVSVAQEENSIGTVTVTGANSLLEATNFLDVGLEGNGTLNIQDSGKVLAKNSVTLGLRTKAKGNVLMDSLGVLEASKVSVGFIGRGFLQIVGGAKVQGVNGNKTQVEVNRKGILQGAKEGNDNDNIIGDVKNNGALLIGRSPGRFGIAGDYTQGDGGRLEIEIAGKELGTTVDWLEITDGTATFQANTIFDFRFLQSIPLEVGDFIPFLTASAGVMPSQNDDFFKCQGSVFVCKFSNKPSDVILDLFRQDINTLGLTVKAVPEPLTILGAGTALGFGAFFKREVAKKQKKEKAKA